ncbi:MAG: SprB repeat-containing protein [Saprospiraceae bacterium]|nr:SprB repeat-containing protein [Saprospiraceae bacterium]
MRTNYLIRIIIGVILLGSLQLPKLSAQCQGFMVDVITDPPSPYYTMCPGDTITLTSIVSGGTPPYSYLWGNGDTNPNTTVTPPFIGNISIEVTDANGCVAYNQIHIKAYLWFADITYNGYTYCPGDSMELISYAVYPPGTTFLWSTGDTTNSTFIAASGTYSLTVTAPGGQCSATVTEFVQMSFFPAPTPNITGTTVLCSGQDGSLTASGDPDDMFLWSTGDNTSTITISSPGTYSVTVTSSSGCTGADTVQVIAGHFSGPYFYRSFQSLSESK